jgi:hypothetical protein
MDTSKIIGALLIIISLAVGYVGINKITESNNSVNLLGIKIEASDESGKQEGYLYTGVAIVLLVGGLYTLNKGRQ